MKIVLIGAGNVAGVLGARLKAAGHRIVQVAGRSGQKLEALAAALQSPAVTQWSEVNREADLYIIAVTDTAIQEVAQQLYLPGKWVVHTAGAVPMNVLSPVSENRGVFYPLQSLRSSMPVTGSIPFMVTATTPEGVLLLRQLAVSMGADSRESTDEQRLYMHLAAVWVNNFPNLLYSIAFRLCKEHQLDFSLLLPLINETGERLSASDPWQWQTGPAFRGDVPTLARHQELLSGHAHWKKLYQLLSDEIGQLGKTK